MTAINHRASRIPAWVFVLLFWALLSIIYASQMALMTPRPAERVIRAQLTWQSVYYLAWAPLTLLICLVYTTTSQRVRSISRLP